MNFFLYNHEVFVAVSYSTFRDIFSNNFFNFFFQRFFFIGSVAKLCFASVFSLASHLKFFF